MIKPEWPLATAATLSVAAMQHVGYAHRRSLVASGLLSVVSRYVSRRTTATAEG